MGLVEEPLREGLKVIVAGAGPTGLLIAHVFKKLGINAAVYERDAHRAARPRDWNFGIFWAQAGIKECLPPEINALLATAQTDPSRPPAADSAISMFNGATGEMIGKVPAPYCVRLRRRAWLDLMEDGIDVRYNMKLVSIADSGPGVVRATFANGASASANLVIGADGAHSATREKVLFAAAPADGRLLKSSILMSTTLTTMDVAAAQALRALNPLFCITFNRNGLYTFFSVHDCSSANPAEWIFMVVVTWPGNNNNDSKELADDAARLDDLRARAQVLTSPFREALASIPPGTRIWHGPLYCWPTQPWDSRGGRVTLAGDAAHPMTFHRGQGLGHAITDVTELRGHLRTMAAHTPAELARAVRAYEAEVWRRGYEAVMSNLHNTSLIHDWERLTQSLLFTAGVVKEVPPEAEAEAGGAGRTVGVEMGGLQDGP
ncbi:hypothetical protein B0T26DRAFT_753425 [Lasiosphaeria miniovina]|uniref:FAD-binding domain-containing protein n=1 Tax=Lasiosphaeria miniovina TaxID=1954250 RepID=A0AA40DRB4_9PEZI|nr:uncharacterized protein B0T26DRAFT_753425 [Lasiosphaeria miniovina]KAK0713299.1 hypothetical protein B0T26DRAFT_753425 [Lasiosphaeria miniovina]